MGTNRSTIRIHVNNVDTNRSRCLGVGRYTCILHVHVPCSGTQPNGLPRRKRIRKTPALEGPPWKPPAVQVLPHYIGKKYPIASSQSTYVCITYFHNGRQFKTEPLSSEEKLAPQCLWFSVGPTSTGEKWFCPRKLISVTFSDLIQVQQNQVQ